MLVDVDEAHHAHIGDVPDGFQPGAADAAATGEDDFEWVGHGVFAPLR